MRLITVCFFFGYFFSYAIFANNLPQIIAKIKPAVVGIGTHTPLGKPRNILMGSGFAISDGRYIITNDHVLPTVLDESKHQRIAVFVGIGKTSQVRKAEIIARSKEHDLAILKINGVKLPAFKLAKDKYLADGHPIAFTGFPIGSILGLYPVTHQGIISAVTPIVIPAADSRNISIAMLKRLRDPYMVYQLDAVAYPGNSGSALYNAETGEVVGIINKVFVQQSKEAVISAPSGITYAIPVKYLRALLKENNIKY